LYSTTTQNKHMQKYNPRKRPAASAIADTPLTGTSIASTAAAQSARAAQAKRLRNTKKNPLLLTMFQPLSSFSSAPPPASVATPTPTPLEQHQHHAYQHIAPEQWEGVRNECLEEFARVLSESGKLATLKTTYSSPEIEEGDDAAFIRLICQDVEEGIQTRAAQCIGIRVKQAWHLTQFRYIYLSITHHIQSALKQETVLQRLATGLIRPFDLASLRPNELDPDAWRPIIENYSLMTKLSEHDTAMQLTTQLTCSRCRKNEIWYYETQTRSADEPMTTFYRCKHCGHRWKS
jgi:DNA-directed RNA polymerase subunit M/transcription elongation factor TFIIS